MRLLSDGMTELLYVEPPRAGVGQWEYRARLRCVAYLLSRILMKFSYLRVGASSDAQDLVDAGCTLEDLHASSLPETSNTSVLKLLTDDLAREGLRL